MNSDRESRKANSSTYLFSEVVPVHAPAPRSRSES